MKTRKKRIYWSDMVALVAPYEAQLVQHPRTRAITLLLNSGRWGWIVNRNSGEYVKSLNELSIEEWKLALKQTFDVISAENKK